MTPQGRRLPSRMSIITEHVCFAMLPVDMKEAVVKPREVLEGNTGSARGVY